MTDQLLLKFPSKHIDTAVDQIASLPGIGKRTALRMVLNLNHWTKNQ